MLGNRFAPPAAENEIREVFGIRGELPTIDALIRYAESRGIGHESMIYDRSIRYCENIGEVDNINIEMFYAGRSLVRDAALNYIVIYGNDRRVICIETRHAYTGL